MKNATARRPGRPIGSGNKVKITSGRTRREPRPRASRTYYAASKDRKTLYRFLSHQTREQAVKAEGLVKIEALEFRDALIMDNTLKVIIRKDEPVADDLAQPARAAKRASKVADLDYGKLGAAIFNSMKPFLVESHLLQPANGINPTMTRQVETS